MCVNKSMFFRAIRALDGNIEDSVFTVYTVGQADCAIGINGSNGALLNGVVGFVFYQYFAACDHCRA